MKACTYCGRENSDDDAHCRECGTDLTPQPPEEKPPKRRDWSWLKLAGWWLGATFLAVSLYFLSFGPVAHYSATVVAQTTTTNANGMMMQRTVRYPAWVGIVYYPAFAMTSSGPDGGLAAFYWRYLQWWEARGRSDN